MATISNTPYWGENQGQQQRKKRKRTKSLQRDGVDIDVTFECGEVNYSVAYEDKNASSRDFHQAIATAGVPRKKVNHLVRALKKLMGL